MKTVYVGLKATIIAGVLFETVGKVVGFDSTEDEVSIKLDAWTTVVISSDYIDQTDAIEEYKRSQPVQVELDIKEDGNGSFTLSPHEKKTPEE